MGVFDVNEENLHLLYHRAWLESGRKWVNPREYPYLDGALIRYAKQNHCSYDEAWNKAKNPG